MYNSTDIAKKIRFEATNKGVKINKMLNEIGLGKNVMSHLDNGSMIKADSLGKIADYLKVSVDYLLGRFEVDQNIHNEDIKNKNTTTVSQLNVGAVGDNSSGQITINNEIDKYDEITKEMVSLFQKLSVSEKINLVHSLYKKTGKKQ